MIADVTAKRAVFRALHESGCFVLPNPWDVGGVRRLERLGFKALATTSSGYAAALGLEDGEITLEQALAHFRELCAATNLPINADFENGFAEAPDVVADNLALALATGIAGISVEDRARRRELYAFELSVARVAACRAVIDRVAPDVLLVARCEALLLGRTGLADVITRLRAYAHAGADCVYAPGLTTLDDVRSVVEAVAPVPLNVLLLRAGTTVRDLASAGVRRVSVGGGLAKAAWRAFDDVAAALAEHGRLPQP